MLALFDRRNDSPNVFTVFNDGVSGLEARKCDFVPDLHGLFGLHSELAIIFRDDAEHVGARGQPFDDHDADIVFMVVD